MNTQIIFKSSNTAPISFLRKTIVPFCTHEGNVLGSSERDIRKLCPCAKILPGPAIHGGSVGGSDGGIREWLKKLEG